MGHGAKSAVVRERAIVALLSEKSLTKAAAKAGVNERTLRRWLHEDEAFKADYATAREVAFEAGTHRVQALMGRAVDTLADLLDEKTQPNVRLGAARTIAELGIQRHEIIVRIRPPQVNGRPLSPVSDARDVLDIAARRVAAPSLGHVRLIGNRPG